MMHKKYREAIRRNANKKNVLFQEHLYEIELVPQILENLNIKIFQNADIEWLDFVLMCRNKGDMTHDYDMVIGATADDDTALCLKVYEEGVYGEKGSDDV